jgi:hypothetical protein
VLAVAGLQQLFEDVGDLPVGERASEVAVLGHADLGVPELVANLAGGYGGGGEEAGDGLAQGVADSAWIPASSRTRRQTPVCSSARGMVPRMATVVSRSRGLVRDRAAAHDSR